MSVCVCDSEGGYVYCAHSKEEQAAGSQPRAIRVLGKNPSITFAYKSPSSVSSLDMFPSAEPPKTPRTPNQLLGMAELPKTPPMSVLSSKTRCSSAPSSVISMASSLSMQSSVSSNSGSSPLLALSLQALCRCRCPLCVEARRASSVPLFDNNDLYRFRCDDSRIERISKMGWLDKLARFRSKTRHFVWDGVRRQLREYKARGDLAPLHKYSFSADTQVLASPRDECVLRISLPGRDSHTHLLRLRAGSSRERNAWLRVMAGHSSSSSSHDAQQGSALAQAQTGV